MKTALVTAAACLILTGCVRYASKPLDPPSLERQYLSRSLDDPGLRKFVETSRAPKPAVWPPERWDLESLSLAAYYFSPEIAAARARYEAARAAILTARGRYNPSLSLAGGYTNSPESPLVLQFDPSITLQTAGKRALRILEAERAAEAARLEAMETVWKVRSAVRAAMLDTLLAAEQSRTLSSELNLRRSAVDLWEKRLSAGEAARPDVEAVRAEQAAVGVALKNAEGRWAESRTQLAVALGVPAAALRATPLDSSPVLTPPRSPDLDAAQQAGLLNRIDVRRGLAEYAVAEAALQLEIARQYPDIALTPGYGFDEGHHKFTIGPSLEIPVINRNRGPIAEAEARRAQAGVEFLALQARAISEIEQARGRYAAALVELEAADAQLRVFREGLEKLAARSLEAGESDRLFLVAAGARSALAARDRLEVLRRVVTARASLEEALGVGLPELEAVAPGAAKKERP